MPEHRIPLGPFELETRVGQGGMGEVWKGRHVTGGLPVAVKVLTDAKHREQLYIDAFRNEVRAVAGLNHPGIVRVLDYGKVDRIAAQMSSGELKEGSPYLVMEFAKRGALSRFQRSIGWREFKAVLFAVLDALAHAHASNVLHRDLKPANILVGCGPIEPGIKLTDFGLAHAIDAEEPDELTRRGWGTPQYMSPEQFRGAWREFGPWTDLYSFGVMAFELATGAHPYEARTGSDLARAHTMLDPRPFVPQFPIPDGFQDWLFTLLQKDHESRFQRAADAAYSLQRVGDPEEKSRTFTLIPLGSVASESSTAPPEDMLGLPEESAPSAHDDETVADAVLSTRLIRSQTPILPTQSLALNEWESDDGDQRSMLEQSAGRVARRAPPLPWTWQRPAPNSFDRSLLGAGLGLFGLARIPVVDREAERDVLWSALKDVREMRKVRGVLVTGSAGTGKSRLAQWLSRRAHEVGSSVNLRLKAGPMTPGAEPLRRMLHLHFRTNGLTGEKLREALVAAIDHDSAEPAAEAAVLAEFMEPPSVTESGTALTYLTPNERHDLIRKQIRRLSRDRPVILWLDDVQWSSDALNLAGALLEETGDLPLLVVMTAREESLLNRPLEHALARNVAARENVRTISLSPLAEADTDKLVRKLLHLEGDLAEEVVSRSGGNPLFAIQIVDEWVEQGKLLVGLDGFELAPGAKVDVPSNIFQIWNERLHNLLRGTEERVLLEVGAALGEQVDAHEWRDACKAYGTPVPREFMQRMMFAGLLEVEDRGWSFSHGMLRETLLKTARGANRWSAIHLACATMLEKRYPKADYAVMERRSIHLLEADRLSNAIEPLLEAARYRIARSDFERAAELLERREDALEQIGVDRHRPTWGEGWLLSAELRLQQGKLQLAHDLAQRIAAESRRHGWEGILPRALLIQGDAERQSGRLSSATRLLVKARKSFVSSGDSHGEARVIEALARVSLLEGEFVRSVSRFTRALGAYDSLDDRIAAGRCVNGLGDVARRQGDFERARTLAIDAMELAESLDSPMGVADSLDDLGELERWLGNYEAAVERCERALRIYDAIGSERAMGVRVNLGLAFVQLGRFGEARALFESARGFAKRVRDDDLLALANLAILAPLAFVGEWGEWADRLDDARTAIERLSIAADPNFEAAARSAAILARQAGRDTEADAVSEILSAR